MREIDNARCCHSAAFRLAEAATLWRRWRQRKHALVNGVV